MIVKMKEILKIRTALFLMLVLISVTAFSQQELKLEKVTVVGRHGLRAPLEQYLKTLDEMTGGGYHWLRWSVPGSYLTPRGDTLERRFGEYFRCWFQQEGFELDSADIYLGASSKQRTVATVNAFVAGMLPGVTLPVDYKKLGNTYGYLDPDYLPLLNDSAQGGFDTIAFKAEAYRELGELVAPSYDFLEKVLRLRESEYANRLGIEHFDDNVEVRLDFYGEDGGRREPVMVGGLRDANMASDAIILQYYEMARAEDAAFGRQLGFDEWKKLASIKDYYSHILFSKAPIISVNVSHCMLKRVYSEMISNKHKFAFFCTHDSMIESLLAALRVKGYVLPKTIESNTPIGVKLLIEQWSGGCKDSPGKFIRVRLLYQSFEQIRGVEHLDLDNPPMSCDLDFVGLEKVSNGMYRYNDFVAHLQKSIEAYKATAKGNHPWK